MVTDFEFKEKYDIHDLVEIIKILRSPGGCPWDREQTHLSIRRDFIEETYEVIEAINKGDRDMLLEELGDVLMQVVFHARIETEQGSFTFDDVADGICQKMIVRHPHVFDTATAKTSEEVLLRWDEIKKRTKHQSTEAQVLSSIPREFPALMRAQKVQKKAAKSGFDWDEIGSVYDKISEEITEVREAAQGEDEQHLLEEVGDLLFACVNLSRFLGVDSEEALTFATDKFIKRFTLVEKAAMQRGIDMKTASLQELDALWEEAKKSQ